MAKFCPWFDCLHQLQNYKNWTFLQVTLSETRVVMSMHSADYAPPSFFYIKKYILIYNVSYLGIFLFGAKWHNNEEGPLEDSCNLGAKSDEVQSIIIYLAILCTKIARVTYIVGFFFNNDWLAVIVAPKLALILPLHLLSNICIFFCRTWYKIWELSVWYPWKVTSWRTSRPFPSIINCLSITQNIHSWSTFASEQQRSYPRHRA